ncbi:MAG: diguanylate cyclase [Bacteroides sp.]|nr:diguanylate cyclase [Eubacterium sp.]MCM1418607.1 diguanylate cyclase [Roseburia sp.]MCM1462661.1 diguanylate cyclase [Bacteroides sp.]
MNIKVKTSLRVILIGVAVLPLLILALVSSLQIFSFSSKMIAQEAGTAGYAYSAGVGNLAVGYLDDTRTLSALSVIRTAIPDLNSVKTEVEQIRKSFTTDRTGVLDVAILNGDGSIVNDGIGSGAGVHFFAFDESWSAKPDAFATGFYENNAEYGESVFVTANKAGDGYVACVVSASAISDYLARCTYLSNGMICVSDASSILGFNGTPISSLSASGLTDSIGSRISSMITENYANNYSSLDDPTYLGAYGKISGTDWVWLSLYSTSAANSAVSMVFIVGLVVLLALALISSLVLLLMVQNVVNPMLNMIDTMKEINSGNRDQRIDTSVMKREFGRISDTFNTMMDEALLSEELHKTVSDLSDNMLFEYDFTKETLFVSNNFKEKIGAPAAGATLNNGKFIDSTMNEKDAEQYKRDMNTLLKNKDDIGGEYRIKDANGKDFWVAMRAHCITDRLGEILRVIGVFTDIHAEKTATLKLAERASFDFLSQLYNRNTFEREFQAELERSANKKIAALFLDVDDFKFINDRYSHAVGDEVIRYVADVIKGKAGETGFAGRFGGDEFVLCVSDPKMIENVEVLSMDIIDDLYSGYYSKSVDSTLNIKASIGIAIYPDHGTDGRTLIACADTAMYFVKKNGKANYHIYDPSDEETTMGAHTL